MSGNSSQQQKKEQQLKEDLDQMTFWSRAFKILEETKDEFENEKATLATLQVVVAEVQAVSTAMDASVAACREFQRGPGFQAQPPGEGRAINNLKATSEQQNAVDFLCHNVRSFRRGMGLDPRREPGPSSQPPCGIKKKKQGK